MPKLPQRFACRIQHWDDERAIGNSLIVTLVDGWKFSSDPIANAHVEGFDTVDDARRAVRSALPCSCDTCRDDAQLTRLMAAPYPLTKPERAKLKRLLATRAAKAQP